MSFSDKPIYTKYINSEAWREKRKDRLQIDGNKCRTCLSKERLEVHHVTYERFGNENLDDLITLCRDCHEAITNSIRNRRYEDDNIFLKPVAHTRRHEPSNFKKERKPFKLEDVT